MRCFPFQRGASTLLGLKLFLSQDVVSFSLNWPSISRTERSPAIVSTTCKDTNFYPLFSTVSDEPATSSPEVIAKKLVEILVDPAQRSVQRDLIGDYIEQLSQAKVQFDPSVCFNGALFAVVHQQGPKAPLWEKIGFLGGSSNVKGQRYTYTPDGGYELLNYAEILGKDLFIQVEGTARERQKMAESREEEKPNIDSNNSIASFFDGLANVFSPPQSSSYTQPRLLQCPCDLIATVEGGGMYRKGTKLVNLPIRGTGLARVLYTDDNLRIQVSPQESKSQWEDTDLITVQVRQDLLLD